MRIAVLMSMVVLALAYLSAGTGGHDRNAGRARTQTLLEAIDRADVDAIHRIVSQGADVNGRFGEITPLTRAILSGRPDLVETLLQLGADVNDVGPTGRTPLMTARIKNDVAVTRILVARGAESRH